MRYSEPARPQAAVSDQLASHARQALAASTIDRRALDAHVGAGERQLSSG